MPALNIAIIGGGPAGLTLANLLLASPTSNPITVTIFERDASASSRITKGGTLDLHADTGLAALDAAGLRPAFDARARYDPRSGAVIFTDCQGKIVLNHGNGDEVNARPEIDREDLKTLLLDALPEGTIRWGARVSSITSDGTLVFDASGKEEPTFGKYDLVVGAEGAWSKVRAHITETRPVFSGISGFELHILKPDESHPNIADKVGHGLFFTLGSEKMLVGHRLGNGAIMLYAMSKTEGPEDPQALIDSCGGDLDRAKKLVKKRFDDAGWAPELSAWVDAADSETLRAWPLYEFILPDGHVYTHRPGWTVVGDAAHVMTPYAGEGVNAGMRDALELAKRLRKAADAEDAEVLDNLVKDYEEEMFARAREVMTETYRNKLGMFDEHAPESMVERMKEMMSGPPV
ncbi:hypothetical protein H0H87_002128 [Tephrocybe sp. NHM501043]|nr:hypothetical protein H0H87_002128 [Tephrocybe sp. NHM501043]